MRIVFVMLLAAAGLAAGEEALSWGTEDDLWHAPSRKASNYAYKYQARLQQLKRGLARQGEEMRLPRDVLPETYEIALLPFIEVGNFTTKGHIDIYVKCQNSTRMISMNAADLQINEGSISVTRIRDGVLQEVRNFTDEQENREIITIHLQDNLLVGERYRVSMNFVSILNDELRGFYRSTYEENGKTKYLAVSQMEAPDARRAFPCFDEPNMKAEFAITIGRKSTMSAISNMPKYDTQPINGMPGYEWDVFEKSVKMSSYLVAMMVSEFQGVRSSNTDIEFKTWARPSYASQTSYSNDIGPRILMDYANKYFNISFPLPKVDMAAIPDFAAGAMENWGLITYREADLLFDPLRSSASAKQRVATIIAHELAHQWFGNLVTMDWWNVIWLNEGFASYMEYPGTHYVEPGFEMNEQFNVLDLHYVFEIDALESSRPIDYEVNTPDQINQMFDAISYEKGSCVIRMCANFLGEPTFRRGVTRYLNRHSYGNTVQEDLWAALQEQADEESVALPVSVKTIMDTWTRQMGYPVVNVTRLYDPTNGAYVTQNRFMLRKSANSTDNHNYRWWIPLTYTSNFSNPIESHWYPSNQGNGDIMLPLKDSSPSRWVIFNVGQEGYYRVVYDERNIHMIHHQLMANHKAISNKNRAQLLDDYLNLARAGVAPYEIALDLTKYLENERDYAPWTAASVALDYINTMLYSLADEAIWKNYMVSLVNPLYGFVGYEYSASDSHLKIFTRSQAVSWACVKLGMADCVTKSKADYAAWMGDPKKELSPNLRRLVSCTAIANGNRTEWNFGYQKYLVSVLPNEKTELLRAITCTYDVAILNEMLEMMINSTSGIRLQDVNTLFSNIAANPVGHGVALDFLINRWDDVYAYFGGYQGFGGGSMSRLFRYLCNRVNTKEKLDKLTKLWNDHADVLQRSASARQGMEGAQANVQWVERYYGTVMAWLKSPLTTTTPVPTTPSSSTSVYNLSQFVTAMVAVFLAKLALQAY